MSEALAIGILGRIPRKNTYGFLSVISTEDGPSTFAPRTSWRYEPPTPDLRTRSRSIVAFTSAAPNGAPFWNFTFLRSWNVYRSPFGETVQLVARTGRSFVVPSL